MYQATVDFYQGRFTLILKNGQVVEYQSKARVLVPSSILRSLIRGRRNIEGLEMVNAIKKEAGNNEQTPTF